MKRMNTGAFLRSRSDYKAGSVGFLLSALVLLSAAHPAVAGTTSRTVRHSFAPYRLTTVTQYDLAEQGDLPASTAATMGRYQVLERLVVRDNSHYRVDVQTLSPAIDAGTLTVTVDGTRMTAYDSRTGEAAWESERGSLPAPTDIGMGLVQPPMVPTPEDGQTFTQYLALLRMPASVLHPGVHVIGHARLLGHPMAVLDYGPIIGTGGSVCLPVRGTTHKMCHATSGTGRARVWVAIDHPEILRYTDGHFQGMPGGMMHQQYLYRVTAVRWGDLAAASTQYSPPTRPQKSTWFAMAVVGGGDSGWFGGWPEQWRTGIMFRAPPPTDSRGHRYVENGVFIRRDTLTPIPNSMDVLYYRPAASSSPFVPPRQYSGSGPYVYLQERIQDHGVPPSLRHGRALRRGTCTVWTGTFSDHHPWVALARQRIAFIVTANALRTQDLISYAFGTLCSA